VEDVADSIMEGSLDSEVRVKFLLSEFVDDSVMFHQLAKLLEDMHLYFEELSAMNQEQDSRDGRIGNVNEHLLGYSVHWIKSIIAEYL
jgi:hypothetical protein